jgi:hypothetical protein
MHPEPEVLAVIARPIRSTCLVVVAAALVAACGGTPATRSPASTAATASPAPSAVTPSPASSTTASPSPLSTPSHVGVLFEATTEGGFIKPSASIAAVPEVFVDTAGRIFTPVTAAGGSSPVIPAFEVRDTGPVGAAAILAAMRSAGLDTEKVGGVAADTGSTVFTAVIDGEMVLSRFAASGPGRPGQPGGSSDPGASSAPEAPGAAAFALLSRLVDPAETWGAAPAPVAEPYVPDGYVVYVAPAGATASGAAPWPLKTVPDAFGTPAVPDLGAAGLRSGVVTGADARTLAAGLTGVAAGGAVESGGTAWSVWVRPLFPGEIGG